MTKRSRVPVDRAQRDLEQIKPGIALKCCCRALQRFRPITLERPKVLLPLVGVPPSRLHPGVAGIQRRCRGGASPAAFIHACTLLKCFAACAQAARYPVHACRSVG